MTSTTDIVEAAFRNELETRLGCYLETGHPDDLQFAAGSALPRAEQERTLGAVSTLGNLGLGIGGLFIH